MKTNKFYFTVEKFYIKLNSQILFLLRPIISAVVMSYLVYTNLYMLLCEPKIFENLFIQFYHKISCEIFLNNINLKQCLLPCITFLNNRKKWISVHRVIINNIRLIPNKKFFEISNFKWTIFLLNKSKNWANFCYL